MMMKCLAPLLAAGLLTGCASMNVRVDVLDPTYPQEAAHDAALNLAAIALVRGDTAEPARVADKLDAVRRAQIDRCYDGWIALGEDAAAANTERDSVLKQPNAALEAEKAKDVEVFTALDQAALSVIAGSGLIRSATRPGAGPNGAKGDAIVLDPATKAAMTKRETGYMIRLQAVESDYLKCPARVISGTVVNADLIKAMPSDAPAAALVIVANARAAAIKANADKAVMDGIKKIAYSSNIGGGKLLFDQREAYYVAEAPKQFWAPEYNKAIGSGQGGGTDIVVKLNDTADFTIKGMVFDARATANLISKVGTSALKVIAASQGLGAVAGALPEAKPDAEVGSAKPDSGAAAMQSVADAEAVQAVTRARQQNFEAQLLRTANHILASWDQLKKNDKTAKDSVKASFDAGKTAFEGAKP